jgi:proteasome lid subunit RPN8/RPN11
MINFKLFNEYIIREAIDHAQSEYPKESCGVFSEDKYIPFENKSSDPENSFLINSPEFNQLYINEKIDCVLHSHEEKILMATVEDQQQQIELNVPFGIIHLLNKSYIKTVFWGDNLEISDLEGRYFVYGVFDCWSLVRDYFRLKGYEMPRIAREWKFWEKYPMYEKFIEEKKAPFFFIPVKEAKPDDVFLYNLEGTKYLNHGGVIVNENQVLHHFVNKISGKFPITLHRQYLTHCMRFDPQWEGFQK